MHRMLVHRRLEVFADHLRRPAEEAIRMRIMVAHRVMDIWLYFHVPLSFALPLIDNRFASSGGRLVFAATGDNFWTQSFPIALELAYRTPAGVKFGVLTVTSKR
jgi:hypothetical protein